MSKQDRQGVRTATDLERKYKFQDVSDIAKTASNAQATATRASYDAASAKATADSHEERIATLEQGGNKKGRNFVTPQMFGAVADGIADDTGAVQAALDQGGEIFFPAGRYKVTKQLTITKSCKVMMMKPYPSSSAYKPENYPNGGDHPKNESENWMGARIEVYPDPESDVGILVGDGVEIDGLFVRAMAGFSGTVFRYDGLKGNRTYPSQTRISHVIIENDARTTIPDVMFDFQPNGEFRCILEDIVIGANRDYQFCNYAFRVLTERNYNWASSVIVRDLCIDSHATYPVYASGGALGNGSWVFENLSIQAKPFVDKDGNIIVPGREGHKHILTMSNMNLAFFLGGHIWDLPDATFIDADRPVFNVDYNTCQNVVSYGSDSFDEIDTVLKGKLKAADNLNITNLQVKVTADNHNNYLHLSDGKRNLDPVKIPAIPVDEKTMYGYVTNWFDEYGMPKETVGKNKYNADSPETTWGYYGSNGTYYNNGASTAEENKMHTSNFIKVKKGDIVRLSKNSVAMAAQYISYFKEEQDDAGNTVISFINRESATGISAGKEITDVANTEGIVERVAYIRLTWTQKFFYLDDAKSGAVKICVTVNNTDRTYEPYQVTLEGGLPSYLLFQSPNGTRYKLNVGDDGQVFTEVVT